MAAIGSTTPPHLAQAVRAVIRFPRARHSATPGAGLRRQIQPWEPLRARVAERRKTPMRQAGSRAAGRMAVGYAKQGLRRLARCTE